MKKLRNAAAVAALAVALSTPFALAATWDVDVYHSTVQFSIRHTFTQVQGGFQKFNGSIQFDGAKPEASSVEFTVEAASIDTNNGKRDDHLRSPDFFDVATHPTLSFKSTGVKVTGKDTLDVTGTFTMRGVSKTITIPVKVLGHNEQMKKAGFSTTFVIDRKDYGVSWNRVLDVGGAVLGDEVTITINVAAVLKG